MSYSIIIMIMIIVIIIITTTFVIITMNECDNDDVDDDGDNDHIKLTKSILYTIHQNWSTFSDGYSDRLLKLIFSRVTLHPTKSSQCSIQILVIMQCTHCHHL